MLKSSAANDEIANAPRMMAGLLFQIPDRTRVRVIDYGTSGYGQPLYRVRVLEGPEVNKAGFVDATFLNNNSSGDKASHGTDGKATLPVGTVKKIRMQVENQRGLAIFRAKSDLERMIALMSKQDVAGFHLLMEDPESYFYG